MHDVSLYIHIPFCAKKCAYCDFVSFAGREGDWAKYMAALEDEFHGAARRYGRLPAKTLFIGGGTPSILPPDAIMHILAMARALFDVAEDAEITLEANPGTLTLQKLRDYQSAGVNRLSIGMQAKSPALLKTIGRIHTQEDVERAVRWARQAGFKNLSLDLIYALPGQTVADWVDTVKAAMALNPEHLSCYSLILEEGTELKRAVSSGELTVPDEDTVLTMQHAAARMLARRGYGRYEISNYAKPGYESRHNRTYWTRGDYLGLGLAAHSLIGGERFSNTEDLEAYLAGTREVSRESIALEAAREEAIMLGTRMAQGIDIKLIEGCEDAMKRLGALGLVETTGGRLRLTERGMDLQNAVVLELLR